MKCTTRAYPNRSTSTNFGWVADVDRLLNDVVSGFEAPRSARKFVPALDLAETDTEYHLVLELPGVQQEDVTIEVKDDTLSVSGEKRNLDPVDQESGKQHRLERSFGSFQRTLQFPQTVDFDQATATFDAGLLRLTVPKAEKAKPRQIQINVPTAEST